MARRLLVATALAAGLVALTVPSAALADDPPELRGAYVLDNAGVLGEREAEVAAALDSLYDRAGIQLFVVYVDTFSGAAAGEWANATAGLNGLGPADLLLAVAVEDRNFEYSFDNEFPISEATLVRIENDVLIPALRNNDWAGAAIDTANALGDASAGSGPPVVPLLLGAGGIALVTFLVVRSRRNRSSGSTADPGKLSQKQLDQRAGSLLVQLDDELRTSEQELGFAVAQFGDTATTEFSAALASAKAKASEAFQLKQALDDAKPDTAEEKRAWTVRIIELCEAADAELDAQADNFDQLRQLEKNAPAAVDAVAAELDPLRRRVPAAEAKVARLKDQYSASAIAPAADNPAQAKRLLAATSASLEESRTAIAAGDASGAAVAVRAAQASAGQATQLLDAVDTLSKDLAAASARLDDAVADAQADLAEAKAVPATGATAPDAARLAPLIASTGTALDTITASAKNDPITSLARIEQLRARLGEGLATARDTQTQIAKAQAALERALASARSEIATAEQFITTRRGAIGADARTRVSEAHRHLAHAVALATTDPAAALREAEQASDLARLASTQAQQDLVGFRTSGVGRSHPSGGDAVLGAVLGGLLGSGMSNNRSPFSTASGRPSGSSRPSFGGSSRSGTSRGGGFGSSSAGRSSGGGRSSRGGRF